MDIPEPAQRVFWWVTAPVWFPVALAIGFTTGLVEFIREGG